MPLATVKLPVVMVDVLIPLVVSYRIVAAFPVVFATRLIAPVWLMMLLEEKVMLDPAALLVIVPV